MNTSRATRKQFLANLQKSGLFPETELKGICAKFPNLGGAREFATALVVGGDLTRFQAELLLAGQMDGLFIGQYKVLKQLGQGAIGKVYKAMHRTMNRIVALKVLAPQLIKTEKARELFQREVLAIGRLVHPNIVTAFDATISSEGCYLVMEYVDGPDLEKMVRKRGPVRPYIACEIIRQAAQGLQYAHEMGMVHRDIKPANLLIHRSQGNSTTWWTVKLVDFGLARLQSNTEDYPTGLGTIMIKENVVMGTPDFLSPEQSRNLHAVDIRSDLYSLGCSFYYLVTGRVPFPGGSSLDKMIRQASETPIPVERLRSEVSAEISKIIAKLMAKEPGARFQTPSELVKALTPMAVVGTDSNLVLLSSDEGVLIPSEKNELVPGEQKQKNQSNTPVKIPSERKPVATIPPASQRLILPGGTEEKTSPKSTEEGRNSYGLYLALGMMFFLILLALLFSLF